MGYVCWLRYFYILYIWQTGSTELCAEDDNAIREYLCTQAYLVCLIVIIVWEEWNTWIHN